MKKSFIIPALSVAILLVVVIVGQATESQPLPLIAFPSINAETYHDDTETIIAKKEASIAKAIEQHTRISDTVRADAARNTKAYSRKNYEKTVAAQEQEVVTTADAEKETEHVVASVEIEKVVAHTVSHVRKKERENTREQKKTSQSAPEKISVIMTIVNGGAYTVSVPIGSTVEAAMSTASAQGLGYNTKLYPGIGSYVTAINGVSEDTRAGMYWIYYMNGAKAQAGISSTVVHEGDQIVWRLEKGQ